LKSEWVKEGTSPLHSDFTPSFCPTLSLDAIPQPDWNGQGGKFVSLVWGGSLGDLISSWRRWKIVLLKASRSSLV